MTRTVWTVGGCVLGLCLTAGAAAAQQRPLLTEDPETVGAGLILLEAGIEHDWDQTFSASGLQGNVLRGPLVGFSFGMGPNAEIQLDGLSLSRLRIADRVEAPLSYLLRVSGDTTRAYEDFVVGAKVRIVGEGARMPAIALRFATRLPIASNESGLGLDTMDFFQSLLVGKTVQSVRLVGNVGLALLTDPTRGHLQNDVMTYGLSLARAFAEGAEIVAEINGRATTIRGTPPPGTESRGVMTFGLRYTRGTVRVDGGLITGFTARDPRVGLTAGLTWVFESFMNP